jgi:hypothetical protein
MLSPILPADYVRYCLRCRVEDEAVKAYYWPKMSEIYAQVAPLIAGWKDCRLRSDQALQRYIGKPQADGSRRSSFRGAALGGIRKLNAASLQDVCTKYLHQNAHLIARFEDKQASLSPFLSPETPEVVYFFLTEIMAHMRPVPPPAARPFEATHHDFYLRIGGYEHQYATTRADPINQCLDLYIRRAALPEADLDGFALALGKATGAVNIWRAESGFIGETLIDEEGYTRASYAVMDAIEDAIDGRNRFGSVWIDLLA